MHLSSVRLSCSFLCWQLPKISQRPFEREKRLPVLMLSCQKNEDLFASCTNRSMPWRLSRVWLVGAPSPHACPWWGGCWASAASPAHGCQWGLWWGLRCPALCRCVSRVVFVLCTWREQGSMWGGSGRSVPRHRSGSFYTWQQQLPRLTWSSSHDKTAVLGSLSSALSISF